MSNRASPKKAAAKPTATAQADDFELNRRLHEGALIGLLAVLIFLVLAMATYSAADPGWSRSGTGERIENLGGSVGAWTADIFFALFGYMAWLFPAMLAFRAWRLFRERKAPQAFDPITIALRVIGLFFVMVASTGLATIGDLSVSSLPFGDGGALGKAISDPMSGSFGIVGSRLLMVAVFLFGVTIFTDLSWIKLMDDLGALALGLVAKSKAAWVNWNIKREEKREAAKARKALEDQQKQRKVAIAREVESKKVRERPKIAPPPKPPEPSRTAQKQKQRSLFSSSDTPVGDKPQLDLLDEPAPKSDKGYSDESLEAMSRLLELKLLDFNVKAKVVAVYPGPVVTRFEMEPDAGVKVSKITNLVKDIARSLAVISVRVVEVIPGKPYVGIEIPNEHREMVMLREVLSSKVYEDSKSPLTLVLGHDISGEPVVADLAKMPHLLVAGTTGSGKSVGVNAMLMSLLYKSGPEDVRMLLVDPKMLELSVYDGIPHLLAPVVTDMKDAANGLRWCVGEMERRYKLMAAMGVRNLAGFNRKISDAAAAGEPIKDPFFIPDEHFEAGMEEAVAPDLTTLPAIVVVIDEFADMMMIVGKKVEELIARIAQKARAAGIHLILATQRPSVDVITGLIKANVPTRIAFQVSSKIDSRTILDQGGAEQLLGHGDMLYMPPGTSLTMRVHGAFVSDEEVHRVTADWKLRGQPDYIDGLLEEATSSDVPVPGFETTGDDDPEADALYDEAVQYVLQSRRASISSVQRKLRIGYNRAARLIETMEMAGVVSEMGSNGSREVLAPAPPE